MNIGALLGLLWLRKQVQEAEPAHICQGLAKYSDPPTNKRVSPAWLSCVEKHGVPPGQK